MLLADVSKATLFTPNTRQGCLGGPSRPSPGGVSAVPGSRGSSGPPSASARRGAWEEIARRDFCGGSEPQQIRPFKMETTLLNNSTSKLQSTSSSGKQPMSATLQERLKKARRSFNSTFTVAKRLKISEENDCVTLSKKEPCSTSHYEDKHSEKGSDKIMCMKNDLQDKEFGESECNRHSKTGQNSPQVLLEINCSQSELLEKKMKLIKQIQEKEELLRRLKLVKMYRSKNNPTELQSLIAKWRGSSQIMLYELQSALSRDGKKLSITELIDYFGLDDQLLHYIRTEEDFTDA